MATIHKMSQVAVAMQSALGAAKTITAISQDAPGVVTATHDFANGDYVVLSIQGMWQLHDRVFRVCNVSTTVSFELEDVTGGAGIDTTAFDIFSSGTAQKVTLGTSITTMADVQMTGGEFDKLDTTVIHSNVKTNIPGAANPFSMDFDHLWDVTDPGQIALHNASIAQSKLAFKFTFGVGGVIMVYNGYVGHSALPNASALQVIKTKSSIEAQGTPTYYSA
ncbi:MAG: phage tail tube protein [Methylobacter tundripaludum]|nr:phage tail tube protein [Methylobacter tundripaludum]